MKHLYRIDDPLEIKLIVLHTLSEASVPLSKTQLTDLILGSAEINYFDLQAALDFLLDAKEVYTYQSMEDVFVYDLTKEGQASAQHFFMRIPLEIREYIADGLAALFAQQRQQRQLSAEVYPVAYNSFSAKCSLRDSDVPLLELTFFAGDREHAKQICDNFKADSAKIYQGILTLLTHHNH